MVSIGPLSKNGARTAGGKPPHYRRCRGPCGLAGDPPFAPIRGSDRASLGHAAVSGICRSDSISGRRPAQHADPALGLQPVHGAARHRMGQTGRRHEHEQVAVAADPGQPGRTHSPPSSRSARFAGSPGARSSRPGSPWSAIASAGSSAPMPVSGRSSPSARSVGGQARSAPGRSSLAHWAAGQRRAGGPPAPVVQGDQLVEEHRQRFLRIGSPPGLREARQQARNHA
jgi:hypothetical protein